MYTSGTERKQNTALKLAIVLLALVMISSLWALGRTFAATPAGHTLTYTTNKLTWDSRTVVDSSGTALLELFTDTGADGSKIIAPGGSGSDSVKLVNSAGRSVTYTAVAYLYRSSADVPVKASFTGSGTAAGSYTLPSGITSASVVGACTGTAAANSETPFEVSWKWVTESDAADTALGSRSSSESVELGIYITVSDEGASSSSGSTVVYPSGPKTGDEGKVILYISLFIVSVFMFVLLLKRDREDGERRKSKT